MTPRHKTIASALPSERVTISTMTKNSREQATEAANHAAFDQLRHLIGQGIESADQYRCKAGLAHEAFDFADHDLTRPRALQLSHAQDESPAVAVFTHEIAADLALIAAFEPFEDHFPGQEVRVPGPIRLFHQERYREHRAHLRVLFEPALKGLEPLDDLVVVEWTAPRVGDDDVERAAASGAIDGFEPRADAAAGAEVRRQGRIGIDAPGKGSERETAHDDGDRNPADDAW